jgi:hypothetical protein
MPARSSRCHARMLFAAGSVAVLCTLAVTAVWAQSTETAVADEGRVELAEARVEAPAQRERVTSAPTRWYKGNTHAHSLWSDGNDFPEMIVDWYHQRDYDFVALSDHNILADKQRWVDVSWVIKRAGGHDDVLTKYRDRFDDGWIETRTIDGTEQVRLKTLEDYRVLFEAPDKFLVLPGEEISDGFGGKPIHINAINLKHLIPPQRGSSVEDTVRNIYNAVKQQEAETGQPILAHLNHPNFGWAITAENIARVVEGNFMEVYNGHPSINHRGGGPRPGDERLWDIANTIRIDQLDARPVYGMATDDSHTYHGRRNVTPGRGWIMVRAAELTPEALIGAMRAGDFYASSGVTLRKLAYDRDAGVLELEIEPDGDAEFTIEFIGTRESYDRTSKPVLDDEGNPRSDITRQYSPDVGTVLKTVTGLKGRYQLRGDELFVRATITSDQPAKDPSYPGQRQKAWTQPVGWERHVNAQ